MAIQTKTSSSGLIYSYDSPVSVTSSWTLVTAVSVVNRRGYVLFDLVNRGANALTNMRVVRTLIDGGISLSGAVAGSDFIVLAEDADINNSTVVIDQAYPNPVYTLAAGSAAQISVLCDGAAEIGIFAKSSGATVEARRIIMPQQNSYPQPR